MMNPGGMGWSWTELQDTPLYVRRFCWDLLLIKRKAEAEALNKNKPGGVRRGP